MHMTVYHGRILDLNPLLGPPLVFLDISPRATRLLHSFTDETRLGACICSQHRIRLVRLFLSILWVFLTILFSSDRNVNHYMFTTAFGLCPPFTVNYFLSSERLTLYSLGSSVLLWYDYLLTIPDEIEYFWMREKSFVAKVFLGTRYLCLFGNIPFAVESYAHWSQSVSGKYISCGLY